VSPLQSEAARSKLEVSIALLDEAGVLLLLERIDGARLHTPDAVTLKARTAAITRTPTSVLEQQVHADPAPLSFPGGCRSPEACRSCMRDRWSEASDRPERNPMKTRRCAGPLSLRSRCLNLGGPVSTPASLDAKLLPARRGAVPSGASEVKQG
jgi:hypothetical protein